jgi:hypothetical protein
MIRMNRPPASKANGIGENQSAFSGLGKSRLLLEFHRRLGAEVTWSEGHSVSFGWSIAYHPLIDLLQRPGI